MAPLRWALAARAAIGDRRVARERDDRSITAIRYAIKQLLSAVASPRGWICSEPRVSVSKQPPAAARGAELRDCLDKLTAHFMAAFKLSLRVSFRPIDGTGHKNLHELDGKPT
jgi:hypothetical protein